jgi:short subunit dehydrogenase-like uncharacterized protein
MVTHQNNGLDDGAIQTLGPILARHRELQRLGLAHNMLGRDAAELVAGINDIIAPARASFQIVIQRACPCSRHGNRMEWSCRTGYVR